MSYKEKAVNKGHILGKPNRWWEDRRMTNSKPWLLLPPANILSPPTHKGFPGEVSFGGLDSLQREEKGSLPIAHVRLLGHP